MSFNFDVATGIRLRQASLQIMELLSIGSQLYYCCICGSLHIWDTPIVKFVTFCV